MLTFTIQNGNLFKTFVYDFDWSQNTHVSCITAISADKLVGFSMMHHVNPMWLVFVFFSPKHLQFVGELDVVQRRNVFCSGAETNRNIANQIRDSVWIFAFQSNTTAHVAFLLSLKSWHTFAQNSTKMLNCPSKFDDLTFIPVLV